MKHRSSLLALIGVGALGVIGCGGASTASTADPDDTAIRNQADHPDGTFDATTVAKVLEARSYPGPAMYLSAFLFSPYCHALAYDDSGSCPCPGGGSVDFTNVFTGPDHDRDDVVHTQLHACATDGIVLDGHEYLHAHVRPSETVPLQADLTKIAEMDVSVADGHGVQPLELRVLVSTRAIAGDVVRLSVKTPSGWLTLTLRGSAFDIGDGHGSFACEPVKGGGYSCTSNDGREPIALPAG